MMLPRAVICPLPTMATGAPPPSMPATCPSPPHAPASRAVANTPKRKDFMGISPSCFDLEFSRRASLRRSRPPQTPMHGFYRRILNVINACAGPHTVGFPSLVRREPVINALEKGHTFFFQKRLEGRDGFAIDLQVDGPPLEPSALFF